MSESSHMKRLAYTPGEFSEFFGKSQTWGYRQIYSGKIKAISAHGRLLVPLSEVERVLGAAEEYNGRKHKRKKQAKEKSNEANPTKKDLQEIVSEMPNAWQLYLQRMRSGSRQAVNEPRTGKKAPNPPDTGATEAHQAEKPESPTSRLIRLTRKNWERSSSKD